MNILITGGTGFIGSNLSEYFLSRGHMVSAVGRSADPGRVRHKRFRYIKADTTRPGSWQKNVETAEAAINLTGATIFKRWTSDYKKLIYDSRILTTRHIAEALPEGKNVTLCSASGVGYYGDRGDDILDEEENIGQDFLAQVSMDWEKAAWQAATKGNRVAVMRFGVVLGKNGGALAKMIPAFKMFVGGTVGSGNQWFPWIHLEDLMAAISFILEHQNVSGPLNFCAPNPVRNRELTKALGEILGRPTFMPAPAFMVRMVMGEFGGVFLGSQRAIPDRLMKNGFSFRYPDIRSAIQEVVDG
ncbi:MAG: TIGR01777 family oxidoreductase [Desulfobacterales bacterium]|jgi:uncharacterized protein (TIGR01777 family)